MVAQTQKKKIDMYSVYDCQNTFFGGHSVLVEQTNSFDQAMSMVNNSVEDLRVFLAEEVYAYLDGKIDCISPLN